jgi:bifunctional non-homologous end joining protein LigD
MRELADAVVPTKAELIEHWRAVGSKALRHLARRPLTLVRHVAGVTFYHKGPLPPIPRAVHQLEIRKADGSPGIRVWVDDIAGLEGLVKMDVIEVHPWGAIVDDIERPDLMAFDLDAGEGIGWEFVRDTAFRLRDLLADEGFDCWPKLTGGSGVHLVAPIERGITHARLYAYALRLAERLAASDPQRYTTQAGAARRIGKLFIDVLRNRRGATAIGPYSPRARPSFPIAVPTTWAKLESGTAPDAFKLRKLRGRAS